MRNQIQICAWFTKKVPRPSDEDFESAEKIMTCVDELCAVGLRGTDHLLPPWCHLTARMAQRIRRNLKALAFMFKAAREGWLIKLVHDPEAVIAFPPDRSSVVSISYGMSNINIIGNYDDTRAVIRRIFTNGDPRNIYNRHAEVAIVDRSIDMVYIDGVVKNIIIQYEEFISMKKYKCRPNSNIIIFVPNASSHTASLISAQTGFVAVGKDGLRENIIEMARTLGFKTHRVPGGLFGEFLTVPGFAAALMRPEQPVHVEPEW